MNPQPANPKGKFHFEQNEIALGDPGAISTSFHTEVEMVKKIYRGESGGTVKVILPSGKSRLLRHAVLHSPSGFAWGYGPDDLQSLLCTMLPDQGFNLRIGTPSIHKKVFFFGKS